ncbi:CopG family ribbon-helix-helix protein [Sphingomonas sp.]|uniref:CopG family ribbon-helix-helix protein n=1 Tax=Sphingomonas sp. TaxID=28214 RepID=UPI0035BC8CBA
MVETVVVTARIPAELGSQLDRVATDYDRPKAWVIVRALERYLAEEVDLLDSIAEGEADLAAGRFYTQEQIEERFGVSRDDRHAA